MTKPNPGGDVGWIEEKKKKEYVCVHKEESRREKAGVNNASILKIMKGQYAGSLSLASGGNKPSQLAQNQAIPLHLIT